jgi:hypothetical protein
LGYFLLLLLCTAFRLSAQSLEIHSEFQRIDPFGRIVAADRSEYPREILSPEVPRNAHSIFHIAVTVPENTSYFLYVGVNPPNLVQTTVYKEEFVRVGEEWIPDLLTPVHLPAFGFLPDSAAMIPGQTTRCYLLDIWVPPKADVRRMRVEVLLKIGTWFVAPMEMRIGEARVPEHASRREQLFSMRDPSLPDVADRIDASAMQYLSHYLLGRPPYPIESWPGGPGNLREAVRRSAAQDIAIAAQILPPPQNLWFLAEDGILQSWMQNPATLRWAGAEWYLRARDWIYRNARPKP